LFGSISANSIADSETQYNFTITSNYTIPNNSAVGAFYIDPLGSGSGSDGIFLSAKTNGFGSTQTRAICHINNTTSTGDCFNFSVCTLGCAGQWAADTTTDIVMLMSTEIIEEEPPNEGNAVNGVCQDGTALDCVGSGTSPFAGITGGRPVTDVTVALTDGLGLTECGEDGDQETCGSGLFTFLFLLLITEFLALAGYLGFTHKTGGGTNLMDIALFMLIIAFVDLSIAFYLNWIPDVVFYTIIVITSALLAFGFMRHFRSE